MCTSFLHRSGGTLIGMNFDSDGMAYRLSATPQAFVVKVDGGWGLKPSFGVTAAGVFANNLMVNEPPDGAGAYKRAGATRTYTQKLAEQLLSGQLAGADIPAYLDKMEIVNGPGHSCHNLIVDEAGNAFVVEPGRGVLHSSAGGSPFFVMANCPLCGVPPGQLPQGDGADRYARATVLLNEAGGGLTVEGAFDILRQTAQSEGSWQTVFSFVYSKAEGAVYYRENRGFGSIEKHTLSPS